MGEDSKNDDVEMVKVQDLQDEEGQVGVSKSSGGAKSLASSHGKLVTIAHVAFFLINIGLLLVSHIGINAYVKASIDLEESSEPEAQNFTGPGACANANDDAVWNGPLPAIAGDRCESWDSFLSESERGCPYEVAISGQSKHIDYMYLYGALAFSLPTADQEDLFEEKLGAEWGYSAACSTCMYDQYRCTLNNCAGACIARLSSYGCPTTDDPAADPCVTCISNNCAAAFEDCSGLTMEDPADSVFVNCESSEAESVDNSGAVCFEIETLEQQDAAFALTDVFEVRFGNAVTKAWQGGAQFLAILVAVASGVWPYMKIVIMGITWFVPLNPSTRDQMLLWLARLGRWSLVDVFAVIIIIVGLRIDKLLGEDYLVVRSESAFAIYCFAIAAILALIQGEVMRLSNRKLQKGDPAYVVVLPRKLKKDDYDTLQWGFALLVFLCLGLTYFSLYFLNISVTMEGIVTGFPGPDLYEYSGFDIGLSLVDSCQIGNPGEYFLLFIFLLTVVVCPTLALLGYLVLAVVPKLIMQNHRGFVRAINVIGNFACLDVFFLSSLVVIAQFEPLVAGSIGDQEEAICGDIPEGEKCLAFVGKVELGGILVGAAGALFWAVQLLSLLVQKHFRWFGVHRSEGPGPTVVSAGEVATEWS